MLLSVAGPRVFRFCLLPKILVFSANREYYTGIETLVMKPEKARYDMADTGQISEESRELLPDDLYSAGLNATWTGMAVNVILIVLKAIGGILGSSAALIADAVHSFSDFITDIGVLIGLRFLTKPADEGHAYGHGRIETAISLFMGITVAFTGLAMLRSGASSILRYFHGDAPAMPGMVALIVAFISILSKEGLFHYTRHAARRSGSKTLEANAWHHRSDALSSVGTVIGIGGAMILGASWTVLDPIAAVFVSLLVIKVGVEIVWQAFRELSDESISRKARERIDDAIFSVEGVRGAHKVRTRSLGRYVTVDAHVQVEPSITVLEGHNIATAVEDAVRNAIDSAAFVTIHIEPFEKS